MSINLIITLTVLTLVVIAFFSGKLPLGLVAMTASVVLCLTGVLTFKETFAYFADSTIVLVFTMLILGGALTKTRFGLVLQKKLVGFSGNGKGSKLVAFYFLICCVLVQLLAPTPLVIMMIPFLATMDLDGKVSPSQLLFPGVAVAHMAQCAVPLGIGLTIYIQCNGFLEAAGAKGTLGVFDTLKVAVIPLVICFLYMVFIGWKTFPKKAISASTDKSSQKVKIDESWFVSPAKEKLIYAVFIATMILLLVGRLITEAYYVFPVVAVLILCYAKAINLDDIKRFVNFDIIFMLGGILPLSTAMQNTGAGELLTNLVNRLLGSNPSALTTLIVFHFAVAILTQFLSNTATWFVFAPLASIVAINNGFNPEAFVISTTLASFGAMLTPMASPSCAVAYGAGGYTMKDIFKSMFPVWIIYNLSCLTASCLFFPLS